MTRLRRLLFRVQAVTTATLAWLQSTDAGNVVLVALALVFGLLGIMSLRVFAPVR